MLALTLAGPPQADAGATNELVWEAPGIRYYRDLNPRLPLAVHVVQIERNRKDLELVTTLSDDGQIGLATLSDQVRSIPPALGKPLAAINGDYFYTEAPFAGDPMNLHILRGGELVSGPGLDRAFFYLDNKGEPHLTNAVAAFTVTWPDGRSIPIGLNEIPPVSGQAVLLTHAIGTTTRLAGVDLILERVGDQPWLPLRIGQTLSARIRQVNSKGYSRITPDTLVLSLDAKAMKQYLEPTNGMALKICMGTKPDLTGAQLGIGGGPSLVRQGKARDGGEFNGMQMRDPRTAIGWNDRYYFFVQADGRQPRYSMGMSLSELADYFVKLGCTYAMNLDGGGSCTTWVNGQTVNSPSQRGRERAAANALVFVRKAQPGS